LWYVYDVYIFLFMHSDSGSVESATFNPIGKVFVPRVDIWTEFLSKPRNHSSLWYYSLGVLALFITAAHYVGHDRVEDELVIVRQAWASSNELALCMTYFCLTAAVLFGGVRMWLKLRPRQSSK
jgi:hypothetical protein